MVEQTSQSEGRTRVPFSKRLVTTVEVAEFMGVCPRTIRRIIARDEGFPAPLRCAGVVRYPGWKVAEWVNGRLADSEQKRCTETGTMKVSGGGK